MNQSSAPSRPSWQHTAVLLMQGPVFDHEQERWRRVTVDHREIDGHFRQIGLRLIVDTVEGYAYLDQLPADEMGELPRIMRRRQLSLGATVYGFFLRQELDRALKDDPAIGRVRRSLKEIRELVVEFFPASNNETADRRAAVTHLNDLAELGFVRRVSDAGEGNEAQFELTRLLRAKFNPDAAQELIARIRSYLDRRQGKRDEPDSAILPV